MRGSVLQSVGTKTFPAKPSADSQNVRPSSLDRRDYLDPKKSVKQWSNFSKQVRKPSILHSCGVQLGFPFWSFRGSELWADSVGGNRAAVLNCREGPSIPR